MQPSPQVALGSWSEYISLSLYIYIYIYMYRCTLFITIAIICIMLCYVIYYIMSCYIIIAYPLEPAALAPGRPGLPRSIYYKV